VHPKICFHVKNMFLYLSCHVFVHAKTWFYAVFSSRILVLFTYNYFLLSIHYYVCMHNFLCIIFSFDQVCFFCQQIRRPAYWRTRPMPWCHVHIWICRRRWSLMLLFYAQLPYDHHTQHVKSNAWQHARHCVLNFLCFLMTVCLCDLNTNCELDYL
jgi:hypothetical protein